MALLSFSQYITNYLHLIVLILDHLLVALLALCNSIPLCLSYLNSEPFFVFSTFSILKQNIINLLDWVFSNICTSLIGASGIFKLILGSTQPYWT